MYSVVKLDHLIRPLINHESDILVKVKQNMDKNVGFIVASSHVIG